MQSEISLKTTFWLDEEVKTLKAKEKLLLLNLMTSPSCTPCGIYKKTLSEMSKETGMSLGEVAAYLIRLHEGGLISYDHSTNYVFIHRHFEWTVDQDNFKEVEQFLESLEQAGERGFELSFPSFS